jgi:hypothetical protein
MKLQMLDSIDEAVELMSNFPTDFPYEELDNELYEKLMAKIGRIPTSYDFKLSVKRDFLNRFLNSMVQHDRSDDIISAVGDT